MIIPVKLHPGDEIRVIAPSGSAAIIGEEGMALAKKKLEALGYVVTFGQHIFETNLLHSSSIQHRVDDLHDAFRNPQVKAILTVIGGYNSNELLPHIDYHLIKNNPKILCGYSDITALATAIMTKAELLTYSGPHFSTFQMEKGTSYHEQNFLKCLTKNEPFDVKPSSYWSDDLWFIDQQNRHFEQTKWKVYTEGEACGQVIGGNLCTLNLLQGTPYFPKARDRKLLLLEDDEETTAAVFARNLHSLLQNVTNVQGILIGRFQRKSSISEQQLRFIFDSIPLLKTIPVMYDVDFGHTQSMFTFPIGGTLHFDTTSKTLKFWRF